MSTKTCTKCLEEKELFEFGKHKDGLRSNCKECHSKKNKEIHKKYPWKKVLVSIKQRCNNPNNHRYKWYGLKGIECDITEEEIKFLWFRDKGYLMDNPSIDRKDNDGNYILENCRFIELVENSVKDKRKIILQYNLKGNFIKEWKSVMQVERELNISHGNISQCANGFRKSAGQFKWRYK